MKTLTFKIAMYLTLPLGLGACTPYLVCDKSFELHEDTVCTEKIKGTRVAVQNEVLSVSATGEAQVIRVIAPKQSCYIIQRRADFNGADISAACKSADSKNADSTDADSTDAGSKDTQRGSNGVSVLVPLSFKEANLFKRRGYIDRVEPLSSPFTPSSLPGLYNSAGESIVSWIIPASAPPANRQPSTSSESSYTRQLENTDRRTISFFNYEGPDLSTTGLSPERPQATYCPGWPPCLAWPMYYPALPSKIALELSANSQLNGTLTVQPGTNLENSLKSDLWVKPGDTLSNSLASTLTVQPGEKLKGELKTDAPSKLQLGSSAVVALSSGNIVASTGSHGLDVLALPGKDKISKPEEPLELARASFRTDEACTEAELKLEFKGDLGRLGQIELYPDTCGNASRAEGLELFVDQPVDVVKEGRSVPVIQTEVNILKATLEVKKGIQQCYHLVGIEIVKVPRSNQRLEKLKDEKKSQERTIDSTTWEKNNPPQRHVQMQLLVLNPKCDDIDQLP